MTADPSLEQCVSYPRRPTRSAKASSASMTSCAIQTRFRWLPLVREDLSPFQLHDGSLGRGEGDPGGGLDGVKACVRLAGRYGATPPG